MRGQYDGEEADAAQGRNNVLHDFCPSSSSYAPNISSRSLSGRRKLNILIAASGSVSVVKIPELAASLTSSNTEKTSKSHFNVKIVLSKAALHFWKRSKDYNEDAWMSFERSIGEKAVFLDEDEWDMWNKIGDPVLHIELRRWADILVVCPASADTMAKIVSGIADNLLLSVIRAWEFKKKPSILCPAMNTIMYEQKVTKITINTLKIDGFFIIDPVAKKLACNDKGLGALAPVDVIVSKIRELAVLYNDSEGSNPAQQDSEMILTPRQLRVSNGTVRRSSNEDEKSGSWEIAAVAVVAMAVGIGLGWLCHRECEKATPILPRLRR